MEDSKWYQAFVGTRITEFKEMSGIANTEGWQTFVDDDEKIESIPIPVNVLLGGNVFARSIVLQVENKKGDFHPDSVVHQLPFMAFERIKIGAWSKVVFANKAYTDLYVPYLLAFAAVGALLHRALLA